MITEKLKKAIKKHKDLAYRAFLEKDKAKQALHTVIAEELEKVLYE
jgi:hypothetical protein